MGRDRAEIGASARVNRANLAHQTVGARFLPRRSHTGSEKFLAVLVQILKIVPVVPSWPRSGCGWRKGWEVEGESGPLMAVHFSSDKWPGGLVSWDSRRLSTS